MLVAILVGICLLLLGRLWIISAQARKVGLTWKEYDDMKKLYEGATREMIHQDALLELLAGQFRNRGGKVTRPSKTVYEEISVLTDTWRLKACPMQAIAVEPTNVGSTKYEWATGALVNEDYALLVLVANGIIPPKKVYEV